MGQDRRPPAGWVKTSDYSIARGEVSIAGYRSRGVMAWGVFVGKKPPVFRQRFADALAFADSLFEAQEDRPADAAFVLQI